MLPLFHMDIVWASYQRDNLKAVSLLTWVLAHAKTSVPRDLRRNYKASSGLTLALHLPHSIGYIRPAQIYGKRPHRRMNNRMHGSLGSLYWRLDIR